MLEMHTFIRSFVLNLVNVDQENVQVLYGGSVDAQNAFSFLREAEVDGVLVGGASTRADEFEAIISAAGTVLQAKM